ncbi:MAG: MBL fold metallo-hydrolase [Chloroflexota bacterium]|nr:MBL fold metallo-hydrolase [Chloroflexota bacterium]
MTTRLTFLGATQNVTGSRYLLEASGTRLLVDCGLHQERELRGRDWSPFPIPPQSLDAVLLTHAHLDHCGLLPKLVREGFRGPIHCTSATAEIAEIMLMDAAKLQEEDVEFKKRRHLREGRKAPYPEVPLYTVDDVKACLPQFSPVRYEEAVEIGKGIQATFHDAGHVLGSAMIKVRVGRNGSERTIVFSGDIGRGDKPMLHDPARFTEADYMVVESTYGDRELEPTGDMAGALANVINDTVKAGGNIVIPSFALERAQDLLYYLNQLLLQKRVPHLMVFVDSPMAIAVTGVFEHHPELFDEEMVKLMRQGESPFEFVGLKLVSTPEESKAISGITQPVIIIAGSGMCTGGRIKHHLVANISRPESTILFVGYQAVGTLGRLIVDGAKTVRILGEQYPVKARIVQLNGFSAHADRDQLLDWVSSLQRPPRRIFITHGEGDASENFARLLRARTGWETAVPEYQEEFLLD